MVQLFFSYVLVIVQFVTLLVLIATGLHVPIHPIGWVLGVGGLVLGLWAILTMRLDRVRVFPTVRKGSDLVTTGPYLWIRHPMYTSLLMIGGTFALNNHQSWRWGVWGLLFVNQIVKLLYEEKLLQAEFSDYRRYMAHSKRLIPFIF